MAILDFCLLLLIPVVLDNGTNFVSRTNFDKNWHIGSCNQRDPAHIGVFILKWPKSQYRLDKSFIYGKGSSHQNAFFHPHHKKRTHNCSKSKFQIVPLRQIVGISMLYHQQERHSSNPFLRGV